MATTLSTYFNRDDELEEFLKRYNDEFSMKDDLERDLDVVLDFIEHMSMPSTSRIWKKADLFTAIIELHSALFNRHETLSPADVAEALTNFYTRVDDPEKRAQPDSDAARYYKAALQATNDRTSRATRGEIVQSILDSFH